MYTQKEINSVFQIITSNGGPAYYNMAAGTGWFVAGEEEGTILTNAHVVREAQAVFIRLPCNHTLDIPAVVHGISTDLDLAVLKLPAESLSKVKENLYLKYQDSVIPTLKLGDSDSVTLGQPLQARGYPLGTEYLQYTKGIFSGLKHANEQVYIAHTSTINPGNSGGPLVSDANEVMGINTMKMQNAEEVNMSIPANRIKRVLPELLDNSENLKQIQQWIAMARLAYNKGQPSNHEVNLIGDMMREVGADIDAEHIETAWKEHVLGGYKRVKGQVEKVTFHDWFSKHIHNKVDSHVIFRDVITHIKDGNLEKVVSMRKEGFASYSCKNCSTQCKKIKTQRNVDMINVPPRVLHMPRLAFKFSNSSGNPTLTYLNIPSNIKTGIVVSDVVAGGLMSRSGLKVKDFIHQLTTKRGSFKIDNFGESWFADFSVSLPLVDIIHRSSFGDEIKLGIIRDGKSKEVSIQYNYLLQQHKPHVRSLDSLKDMPLTNQVVKFKGLVLKPLRLDDVYKFKLAKYMNPHRQNDFKVVVVDIQVHSDAFHAKNIVPGDVLTKVNDEQVGNSWNTFVKQLSESGKQTLIECERGELLII